MYAATTIAERCRAEGLHVEDVRVVTESDLDPVYLLRTADGRKYAKVAPPEYAENTRAAIESGVDFGIPESRVVGDDPVLVVMEPATGRPMSIVLPVLLSPGLWRWARDDLANAVEWVGRYLGRLHQTTRTGTAPVRDGPWAESRGYHVLQGVESRFDDRTVEAVRASLRRLGEVETPTAFVNGDPTPHNLYYDGGSASIIDFTFREAYALRDCVVCDCGLELMCARVPYGRRSQYRHLRDAFWRGYASVTDSEVTDASFRALKLRYYCHVLDQYLEGGSNSIAERLTRLTDVRILERTIERLASEW